MLSKPIATDPELLALLAKSKSHVMTKEEREAQRRSWVIGEAMLSNPILTRDEANRIYDEVKS